MTHDPMARPSTVAPEELPSSPMRLELISKLCGSSTCPTIYQSDRGTLVVQGYVVSSEQAGVDLPDGELMVEIPVDLLKDAARGLS